MQNEQCAEYIAFYRLCYLSPCSFLFNTPVTAPTLKARFNAFQCRL